MDKLTLEDDALTNIKKAIRKRKRVFIHWMNSSYDLYPHPASAGIFFNVGMKTDSGALEYRGRIESVDPNSIPRTLKAAQKKLLLDFLDAFGKVDYYPRTPRSIIWWISPHVLLAFTKAYNQNPNVLGEIIKTAKNQKDFLALSALI